MPEGSPTIRKVQTSKVADFDDQLWPINCGILILAGFVAGIVAAKSDFHDPHLIYNGWARLASVGVMVGLLIWGVIWLQGKMLRRLQLCIVISLLVHLWIAMYLRQQYLTLMAMQEAKARAQATEPDRQITVSDHPWPRIDQPEPQQSFEKPIETEAPKPTEPEAVKREADQPEMSADAEPPDEPETPQRQQPNPALARRAELSAPRRADAAAGAQISRQEWKHLPNPNEPVPEPEINPEPRQVASVPGANIAPRRQQETEIRVDQRQTFEEVSSVRAAPLEVAMARRATGPEPIPDVPTTPTPTRAVSPLAEVPRTQAAAPEPVSVARRFQQLEPKPAQRMIARQQADPPRLVRQTSDPTPMPTAPRAVAHVVAAERGPEQTVQLAQAARAVATRRPFEVRLPSDVAVPQAEAAVAAVSRAKVEATPTPVLVPGRARTPTAPSPVSVAQPATNLAVQAAPSVAAEPPTRRAQDSTQTSPQPRAGRAAPLARAQQAPQIAATRIEQAAVTQQAAPSTQPSLPMVRPDATAVSRVADTSARPLQSQPPGRAVPAMTRIAQLPSALAVRRASASQQQPLGMDAAPARPTSLARFSAGAGLPSTAIPTEAQPAATPAAAGGTPASRLSQVASSAAVRRAGAQPPSGRSEAAAGTAEFALGSGQIVARTGQPRATGTGQPSATANALAPRLARATGPAASTAVSGVPEAAAAAPGAVASSVRGPSAPSFNVRASAARRGGTARQFAEQAALGSGPAGSRGTPGPIHLAQSSRVTRYESVESGIAGGGTPRPGRTAGGAVSPDAAAEAPQIAMAAPSGGTATQGPPLHARIGGPRRQVTGLPGVVQSQPRSGALASLSSEGAALAGAVARRATASGLQPGAADIGAARDVTMRRAGAGTDLPAAAVPVENISIPGAGGVAVVRGGLPSSLETGSSATVRRAAADVSVGETTAASGTSESGIGSARAVAMAGQARATGDDVPAPAASAAPPEVGRSTAVGPAIATGAPLEAYPAAEVVAGGPAVVTAAAAEPVGGTSTAAVARGAGGLPTALLAEEVGPVAAPEGGAVAVALLGRAGRGDAWMAATSVGAVAGPVRRMGAMDTSGTSTEAPELAEAGPSSGGVDAAPDVSLQANLTGPQRQMAGLPGSLVNQEAVEGAAQSGPAAMTPGTARGRRRLPQGDQPGPSVAAQLGRGPLQKTDAPGLPRGVAQAIEGQPIAAAAPVEPGDAVDVAEGAGVGEPGRREGGLPVQIAAMAGPGGLGYDPSPEVGLPSRRARPESEIIHTVSRRFVIERSGGELAIDGRVREQPAEAFRQRDPGRRAQAAQAWGGSEGTEKAVEMGLDYFARHQFPDGRWSLHELPEGIEYEDPALGQMEADTAATGLALLTYLGAGYTHLDDKHRAVVNRGIDWLVRNQKDNGDLFTGGTKYAWFYSHGIAAIALCEAYGMTQDPELREPARMAIDFIVKTQHPTKGGWRYSLDKNGVSAESDTSVSGWMLMALKSAQMAGLEVPEETLERVDRWLDSAEAQRAEGQYIYNPYADESKPEQGTGLKPNLAMTSEAMLMRMYLGYDRGDPGLIAGAEHLKKNLPEVGTRKEPLRDCYYWYYATQAMFQMQQDYWTAWNDRLRPLFESSQVQFGEQAGSWHPMQPVRDRWGREGGRHYVTALHLLVLEVYYRHLPLFQELSK